MRKGFQVRPGDTWWSRILLVAIIISVCGCSWATSHTTSHAADENVGQLHGVELHPGAANRVGIPVSGGGVAAADPSDDSEEKAPKDYWKPISSKR